MLLIKVIEMNESVTNSCNSGSLGDETHYHYFEQHMTLYLHVTMYYVITFFFTYTYVYIQYLYVSSCCPLRALNWKNKYMF